MKNDEIKDLTQEQIEQVAGGEGELVAAYLRICPEDTKGNVA